MGCSSAREKIEDQIMQIKLKRIEIQMERENRVKQLSEMEGRRIYYQKIPDYIDPKFAIEKNIFYDIELLNKLTKETLEKEKKIKTKKIIKNRSKNKKKS